MPWRTRFLIGVLLSASTLLSPGSATAQTVREQAQAIIDRADKAGGDKQILAAAMRDADALVAREPSDAVAHFARGFVLTEIEAPSADRIAAYRRATELDPAWGNAFYNLGVALGDAGRREEAISAWNKAFSLDPQNVDAAYNLGINLYLLGRFDAALENWLAASKLTPDDFQIARKLVQGYNALGRDADAARAREQVLRIKREQLDPSARDVSEFCFDQIVVKNRRVYAYEPFSLTPATAISTFKVADLEDNPIGTIELVKVDAGYLLRISLPAGDSRTRSFTARPAWRELKPIVTSAVAEWF